MARIPVKKWQTVQLKDQTIRIPHYNLTPYRCSFYVRLAAREIFGKVYPYEDAWKMRNHPDVNIVAELDLKKDNGAKLEEILEPGMVIGIVIPNSRFARENRPYTHVALYLGMTPKQGPIFAEQNGPTIQTIALEEYTSGDPWLVKEVLNTEVIKRSWRPRYNEHNSTSGISRVVR